MPTTNAKFTAMQKVMRELNAPLTLRRDGKPPVWGEDALHQSAYSEDAGLYALLSLAGSALPTQRARGLFQILKASRQGMDRDTRRTLDRVTAALLAALPADLVLTVFLALKRMRANHKHATKAILTYLLNHPQLEDLITRRRPAAVDALEHALGKSAARYSVSLWDEPENPYVKRHLLRFANDAEKARQLLPWFYIPCVTEAQGTAQKQSEPLYSQAHNLFEDFLGRQTPSGSVTPTNRGDIAATLTHLYQGGESEALLIGLEKYITEAASRLPRFRGHLALVLDASASMRSYGDREYCILAQSVALQRVLEKQCDRLDVLTVGGADDGSEPAGCTDLATGLLDALENSPDLVAIVSDGYENALEGDLARVAAGLPQAGVTTPVVFCHSKFGPLDDLALRRPAPELPEQGFWHQDDFEELLLTFSALVGEQQGEMSLREFLLRKLARMEQERALWTTHS